MCQSDNRSPDQRRADADARHFRRALAQEDERNRRGIIMRRVDLLLARRARRRALA